MEPGELDHKARQVIHGAEEILRHHLGIARLDREVVGDLYLRVREVLCDHYGEGGADCCEEDLEETLALAVFLVVGPRLGENAAAAELLGAVRRSIARSVAGWENPGSSGPGGGGGSRA